LLHKIFLINSAKGQADLGRLTITLDVKKWMLQGQ
jgi:hypothetical protein